MDNQGTTKVVKCENNALMGFQRRPYKHDGSVFRTIPEMWCRGGGLLVVFSNRISGSVIFSSQGSMIDSYSNQFRVD